MITTSVGFFVSAFCAVLLILIFRFEERRGKRYGEHVRAGADLFILRIEHATHQTFTYIGGDLIKQIGYYAIHSVLRLVLSFLRKIERSVYNTMRVNKTLAKHAQYESEVRTKLEEVALHKAEHALTDEEKHAHKERSLRGM